MKKFQKGNNNGYALLYVLIVIMVLCAIAMAICTIALRNFQSQERSVAQMRQLYQAEGEIEKFVALAEDMSELMPETSGEYTDANAARAEAERLCKDHYQAKLNDYKTRVDDISGNCTLAIDTASNTDICKFMLTYQNEVVKIETMISIALKYEGFPSEHTYDSNNDGIIDFVKYSYTTKVSKASHTYNTYVISRLTEEGGGAA